MSIQKGEDDDDDDDESDDEECIIIDMIDVDKFENISFKIEEDIEDKIEIQTESFFQVLSVILSKSMNGFIYFLFSFLLFPVVI